MVKGGGVFIQGPSKPGAGRNPHGRAVPEALIGGLWIWLCDPLHKALSVSTDLGTDQDLSGPFSQGEQYLLTIQE
jgi:hypothetical protein